MEKKYEIALKVDYDLDYCGKLLESNGFKNINTYYTNDEYYAKELNVKDEDSLKESCVRIRRCRKNNDIFCIVYNYNIFDTKHENHFESDEEEIKKIIELLNKNKYKLILDTKKIDYQYNYDKKCIQLQDIEKIGFVLYYDNKDYYKYDEDKQRKLLVDELNSYGFKFNYDEPQLNKLEILLTGD
ncbi:MAG: hypothetical protein R3Y21_02160 [Mycoplasmatota bacterium]